MAQPGILSWATSIRATMVNDLCRQSFEDQIQMHGFLFLDDYLDNILAQAKQDPIIDLVKTPGRKKASSKRTMVGAMAAKAKPAVTLSAEEDDAGKENQAPVNSFHQALLQAKNNGTANMTASSSGQTLHSIPLDSPETQQPQQSTRQSGANSKHLFPSLPAPSPLRKSMRIQREPSMGVGPTPPMPVIANAAVGAGKRTSWLMKAREVKAMEVPGKQAGVLGPSAVAETAPVPGLKRKSGEMLATAAPGMTGMMALEDNERKRKIAKINEVDAMVSKEKSKDVGTTQGKEQKPSQLSAPTQPVTVQVVFPGREYDSHEKDTVSMPVEVPKEGMMDRLKRTVEGLAGKTMTKSLGGPAAAAALAEAKAAKVAAEARIAERDGRRALPGPAQETIVAIKQTTSVVATTKADVNNGTMPSPKVRERKLSVSDLVTAYQTDDTGKSKAKTKEFGTGFEPVRLSANKTHIGDESTSTTPPNSPPPTRTSNSSFGLPPGPVFNKPPVFVPPAPAAPSKDFSFNLPVAAFALPAASSLDMSARLPSPSAQKSAPALSAHSTAASLFSDSVFESQSDVPAWMPSTQDTDYSIAPSEVPPSQNLDEDDSWPMVDEKLAAANPSWTPFGFTKEDSMTWSTLPTESQRETRSTQNCTSPPGSRKDSSAKHVQGALDMEVDNDDRDLGGSKLEDLGLEHDVSNVGFAKELERSQSQMSIASTSSSQSQIGWVGQATKLVSSVLGGSKNKKPQVPSLQRAAAAARKEQEEKNKKVSRMKEMENRRQLAIQRKAEEEKSKVMEEEKKIKEDGEKRKREREETTDKRPLKAGSKRVEEDTTKKRKVTVDIEKKPVESKKPPSKEKKDIAAASRMLPPLNTSTTAKPAALNKSGGGFKPSGSNPVLRSSATYNAQVAGGSNGTVKLTETKTIKASTTTSVKGKGKAKIQDDGHSQPTHQLQIQMAARAKAQIQAAKQQQAEAENIELPDINSEYSDSDDEDRPRTFDPPDWAQSPELRQQLHMQSTVNPDDIFGPIRPLKMEEVFRTRQSRFRARTSSANWTGNDRLTVEEEKEYARRMGFR